MRQGAHETNQSQNRPNGFHQGACYLSHPPLPNGLSQHALQGPELAINYKAESSNLKVQNDGKVLKVVGFKSSSIKYRTTTYQLEEVGSCELVESM